TIQSAFDATSYAYRYELPSDHPVGTFWYHPHKHGSVAAQVGPGMAGALIVRAPEIENDFDTLLATNCNITANDEEIVVLQTISYFETTTGGGGQGKAWSTLMAITLVPSKITLIPTPATG
ncbi:MAG: multicopper oxidase domain-containing protein, partial [Loktanella sp.]|nr:multicopper oxidase domain-containing protein [Loktanella sp.]